jgi:hypothetical protein
MNPRMAEKQHPQVQPIFYTIATYVENILNLGSHKTSFNMDS